MAELETPQWLPRGEEAVVEGISGEMRGRNWTKPFVFKRKVSRRRESSHLSERFGWLKMKAMAFIELEVVALTVDFPNLCLRQGDLGTIVHVHKGGEAIEVEFVASNGHTVALDTFLAAQVRPIQPGENSIRRAIAA